jgi:dipeptidyl aminopeptidase/acylaminoacyl peptidase
MSEAKPIVQYGLWPSPMQPQDLAEGIRFSDVAWDSDGETLVWKEERSDRGVLVCLPPGGDAPRDLTSAISVRARVGYGGGDFTVAGGHVYFAAAHDGRLYRQALHQGGARPITPGFGAAAAPAVSPDRRGIVFVHTYEDRDCLAIVDAEGRAWPQQLVSGDDFYMQPCWHPHGDRLAWIAWNHPQMPWEGSRLQIARLQPHESGLPGVSDIQTLAGSAEVGIFQPTFSPDGRYLAYISNASGWDALYLYDIETHQHRHLMPDEQAEMGQPAWAQGMRSYGFRHDGRRLYVLRNEAGLRRLMAYDLDADRLLETGALPAYTYLEQPALSPTRPALACIASSATQPSRVMALALDVPDQVRICRRSSTESVHAAALSTPQTISWAVASGARVYGLYYPPQNLQVEGRGKPPAIIIIHGGPTSQAVAAFQANVQYFATRGFAVLQVNYRGSTGYGKAYVEALRGQWGVTDVEDAVTGAQYLIDQGWADAEKLVIMGGSAGGYTVLQALVRHPGFFKAGLCLYGIANLFTLAAGTHKFEAHYLDSLIGPLPQAAAVYRERSPLFHAAAIQDPVAIFQGEIDQVVPKDQAEAIVASLKSRGVPHEYHEYAGEGHGFRKTETIAHFYTAVEAFLRQYVVFA